MGYRFRLHQKDLPGRPDLVFGSQRKVIFVHGCFWHSHNCKAAHIPKSNQDYWVPKLERNRARDANNLAALKELGWTCLVIWACEVRDVKELKRRVMKFLGARRAMPQKTLSKI
jgi:DNA mismatch endonuclease (patch repair protein)